MTCNEHKNIKKENCKWDLCHFFRMCLPGPSCTTPGSHIVRLTSNMKRKDRGALVEQRSVKLTCIKCVSGQGRLNMSEVNDQEIVEWYDSDDDYYFSDDESLFSEDDYLLHDDDNDIESSVKENL